MKHRFVLYHRRGCGLCDEMLDELEPRLRGQPAELRMVDIDTDPGLRARYDIDIPVLTVNDIEVCRHRLDHAAIDKILCG